MDWYDIHDPNDPRLDELAARYHLHPLHVEDCRHRNQMAKVEEDPGYLFVVVKPVELDGEGCIRTPDLDLFLGDGFLITVQEGECSSARRVLDRVKADSDSLRPDQILYRIMDGIVDSYLPILDHFNDVIDALEDEVLEKPTPESLSRIFQAKRNLIELRRVLANMRDASGHLQRSRTKLIPDDMWPFLRDLYDHLARNLDMVEMQRDLLTGSLDIYLSSIANRTNQVMKVLTVMSTVALPVLLVSSVYGMNVKGLPWSESPHSIVILGMVMSAMTIGLLLLLRRFRWL